MDNKTLYFWVFAVVQFISGYIIIESLSLQKLIFYPEFTFFLPTLLISLFLVSIIGIEYLIFSKK